MRRLRGIILNVKAARPRGVVGGVLVSIAFMQMAVPFVPMSVTLIQMAVPAIKVAVPLALLPLPAGVRPQIHDGTSNGDAGDELQYRREAVQNGVAALAGAS